MRKRLLSVFMVLALVIAMAPAAFAAETNYTGTARPAPDEELIGTKNVNTVSMYSNDAVEGITRDNPIVIASASDFYNLMLQCRSTSNMTYKYVKIVEDIDLPVIITPENGWDIFSFSGAR